jgi:hypothetical protein
MVSKGKKKSTYHVVSFKLNDEDYKKVEKAIERAKSKGLKLNKAFVFAMAQYFGINDCSEQEQEFEQKKEQKNEKSTIPFMQKSGFHESENKLEIEKLPSYFENNPWISILATRK